MNSALTAFQSGIADLRWHIESIGIESELLAAATATPPCSQGDRLAAKLKEHFTGRSVAKRRFDYNSLIISLYGLLEQYIEGLVRGYSASLNALLPRYADMPDPIKHHISLCPAT
jgi:hypothetical protein